MAPQAVIALIAHRLRRQFEAVLAATLLAGLAVAFAAVTRIQDVIIDIIDHEVCWISAIGADDWLVMFTGHARATGAETDLIAIGARPVSSLADGGAGETIAAPDRFDAVAFGSTRSR